MKEQGLVGSTSDSVIPTEVEGSRAVYGKQARASRLAGLPRSCRDPSMHPEDGARSLHFGRDDGHIRCTFVQRERVQRTRETSDQGEEKWGSLSAAHSGRAAIIFADMLIFSMYVPAVRLALDERSEQAESSNQTLVARNHATKH